MSTRLTSKDLKDIQNVLWDAQTKWFNIGIQLGLDSVKLEAIKCNCADVEDRFTRMLSEWLVQVDPEPTWDRLVSALKARPVNCKQIAQEIEQKYCTKEPIPDQNPPLTLAAGNVAMVKHSDIEETDKFSTLPDPPRKVMIALEDLDDSFWKLVDRTCKNLCQSDNFNVPFLRRKLNTFPSRRRFEHQEFLDKYILKMEHGTTADDLWSQLCSYWHFINYGLLKFIIDKTECRELISDMNQYEIELRAFSEETSIHDFVKCFPVFYQRGIESANKSELNIKVGDKFKLSDLNCLEKAFVTTFSLPEICGLILKKISTGCFNITWMVPVHYAKLLRWKLSICDEEFFKKHDIESVSLDGEECYFKGSERTPINPAEEVASNMEIIHEEFELLNMMEKVVKSFPPFTVTQLCTAYTCKLLTHHLSNHPVYGEKQLQIHKFSDLPPEIHRQFIYLSRLAYEEFITELLFSQLFFHSHHLFPLPGDIDGLGLTTYKNSIHMFIHKTLQCYLAAVHISTTITDGISEYAEELSPYIKAAGYLPYFVAGLSKLTFMDEVFTILKENVSIYLMSFEANDPDIAKKNFSSSKVMTLKEIKENFIELNTTSEAITHFSVDSGIYSSTRSHLSVDSGSRHSSTRSHLSVDSGSRHSSTRSHLSVDSGLGIHSSSTSTGSHLSVDSGLGIHSSSTSTGSHFSDVDSGLGIHSGSSNSDLGIGRMRASMFHLYSSYVVGWGMYFSNSSWQLFDLFQGSLSTEGLTQGLIAAAESVYNYQGLTLPQRNFKLSLELRSYDDIEWLTYMPYSILHRIDAVNFIRLQNLIQDCKSHINALFESLLSLREVKFWSITDCELLNWFIVALRQNASQVTNLTLLESSINKGIYHELAKMLQANTALKELNLSWNGIRDEGACELAKMLQANTALKELNLSRNGIGDEGACELAKMLQANTALKELNLFWNRIGNEGAFELAKMLQANTALKELNLSRNGIRDEGARELAKMLQANTALKELNLSWNGIGDEGARELAKMLQANTALKELNLSRNGIGDEGACELAKMLQANTALKELNLSGNGIGVEGACELAKMLQANTALKELNLFWNRIGNEGAFELAKMLQANTALKELNLSGNGIRDEGARELAKMLQANTALKELNLSQNGIGDEGACELAKMLQANTALKELNLSQNGIGDEGACELAKMLQANTALKELNLSWNGIGDEGARELAKMLQANTALKELDLSGNRIGGEGALALANMLQANTALKELDLSWNGIGGEGAHELAKMLQENTVATERIRLF